MSTRAASEFSFVRANVIVCNCTLVHPESRISDGRRYNMFILDTNCRRRIFLPYFYYIFAHYTSYARTCEEGSAGRQRHIHVQRVCIVITKKEYIYNNLTPSNTASRIEKPGIKTQFGDEAFVYPPNAAPMHLQHWFLFNKSSQKYSVFYAQALLSFNFMQSQNTYYIYKYAFLFSFANTYAMRARDMNNTDACRARRGDAPAQPICCRLFTERDCIKQIKNAALYCQHARAVHCVMRAMVYMQYAR